MVTESTTTHTTWQQKKSMRRRATIGDLGSPRHPQANPMGLSEQLEPLEGMLHKQHRASKVRAWGKRYFRVDDLRETLCYYRTEAQFDRQDPVLRLPLRNLASVRKVEQPPLEFLFELRLFSPVVVAGWAGRSCGIPGQQRPEIDDNDDDNEYEVSDKQARPPHQRSPRPTLRSPAPPHPHANTSTTSTSTSITNTNTITIPLPGARVRRRAASSCVRTPRPKRRRGWAACRRASQ